MPDVPTRANSTQDASTARAAADVLSGESTRGWFARIVPFLGPAFIAAVAYVDPGNFATNIQAGAKYGYLLIWVVVASNLMAMLIQMLSAKLGIATGRNLPEMCRESYRPWVVWGMWGLAEIVAMATDLAEFLGAAVGLELLFGMPLIWGGFVTAIATFVILGLERRGFRPLEAVIAALVGVIAVCYVAETVMGRPNMLEVARNTFIPRFQGKESVLLATGILGATVMPHVIYLHSALTQGRVVTRDERKLKLLARFELIDIVIAMVLAGFINAAMLMMAAATFNHAGLTHIASIEEAHRTLKPLLGPASSYVFGISLLAAGLSSSAVGTMAGQVVMQGFIKRRIPVWIRRSATMAPSLVVIAIGFEPTRVLVMSQVVLSFGIPFALIPLIVFTADRRRMGVLVNRRITTVSAWLVAALIVALNIFLIYQTVAGG